MAIGSQGEIGAEFDHGPLAGWLNGGANEWRTQVGDNLLGGYAHLDYVTNHPDICEAIRLEAIQMHPMWADSEDTDQQQIRSDMLARGNTPRIILNKKDGGNN